MELFQELIYRVRLKESLQIGVGPYADGATKETIAYTSTTIQGQEIKRKGVQKYVGRLQESGRVDWRHSSFYMVYMVSQRSRRVSLRR